MRWYQGTDSTYVQMLLRLKIRYVYTVQDYSAVRLDIQPKERERVREREKAERFLSSLSHEYIFLLACLEYYKTWAKISGNFVLVIQIEHCVEY